MDAPKRPVGIEAADGRPLGNPTAQQDETSAVRIYAAGLRSKSDDAERTVGSKLLPKIVLGVPYCRAYPQRWRLGSQQADGEEHPGEAGKQKIAEGSF